MAYIFTKIATAASNAGITPNASNEARSWFRAAAGSLSSRNVNSNRMMNDMQNVVTKIDINSIGRMYMFFYDPKNKDTLPYYDTFPLVFPIGFKDNGFLGLNLHYLPPVLRAKLMDALYTTANNTKYDESTKLKLSYDLLNGSARFNYFAPCLKHYLWNHVPGNKYLHVEINNWDTALMLPTQRFRKAQIEKIYKDSISKVS